MSPSSFKGFVLLGFLCLWVTPTEQELTIQQYPSVAKLQQPVLLIVNGVDPNTILYYNWFQDIVPKTSRHLIGYVKRSSTSTSPTIINGTYKIGDIQALDNGTLKILSFSRSQLNFYTIQLQSTTAPLQTRTTVLYDSSSTMINPSFFLLATVLFSLKLL